MYTLAQKLVEKIEAAPISLGAWGATFLALIFGRLAIEHFFIGLPFQFSDAYFYQFTHHFFTFLCIFLIILFILQRGAQVTVREAINFLTLGFFIIWTPPIVDEIISGGIGFQSFYAFDSLAGLWERYLTFFGDKPNFGITYGIRVEIAIALIALAGYIYLKTRNLLRTLLFTLALYTALFIVGVLPSLVTIATTGMEKGVLNVTENDVAILMLSPTLLYGLTPPNFAGALNVKMSLVFAAIDIALVALLLFVFFRPLLLTLWKNARFPQLVYHGGLLLLGGLLVYVYGTPAFTPDIFHILGFLIMLAAVECAWLASVVVNDIHDTKIDALTNKTRPLPTGSIPLPLYRAIGLLFFLGSLLLAALISTQAAYLLAVYQGIAWIYSAWPLRLKRIPIIATGLAALASLMILFAGYIIFDLNKSILELPWQIPLFLLITYTLMLPIKDFKDIEGDRADGVFTLPVLLGERIAKRLLGGLAFILFVGSVFVIGLTHLFPLALFLGSVAYWIIQNAEKNHRFLSYHRLAGFMIALIVLQGFFFFLALLKSAA